jgi:hypothetical protein
MQGRTADHDGPSAFSRGVDPGRVNGSSPAGAPAPAGVGAPLPDVAAPLPDVNVPLVDLGSMMLWATRHTPHLPNMALLRRFPGIISDEELAVEARRIAGNPYGLGRKLVLARVPGARPLWRRNTEHTPLAPIAELGNAADLAAWLTQELSVREDPLAGAGWHLAAATMAGSTYVVLDVNHLFGAGRDIMEAIFAERGVSYDAVAATGPVDHDVRAELRDLGLRLRTGFGGFARLGSQLVTSPQRRAPHGDAATLRKPLDAALDRDPSRGAPSTRRVATFATIGAVAFNEVAARHGGTALSLQVAITTNLLREARIARGGPRHRPLRMIIPVDVSDRSSSAAIDATLGPVELTSAGIVVSGGLPSHGDLTEIRDSCREAIANAKAEVAATGRVPVAPGMVDALRILPDAVTTRAVIRVHSRFDGAVSSLGPAVPGSLVLGDHAAAETYALAFPMGSDISICTYESNGMVGLGLVADPSRLGAGPAIAERLTAELAKWGLRHETGPGSTHAREAAGQGQAA